MHTAVVAEACGQLVPLTACPHPKNDAVEGFSGINAGASGGFRRIIDRQYRLNSFPERVGNDPNGGQRFGFVSLLWTSQAP